MNPNNNTKRPPDLPAGDLSIRRRNRLNVAIEDQNDDAILYGGSLKAYWAYSDEEIRELAVDQRLCDDVGPLPCFLWSKIQTIRDRIRMGTWDFGLVKEKKLEPCVIKIDSDDEIEFISARPTRSNAYDKSEPYALEPVGVEAKHAIRPVGMERSPNPRQVKKGTRFKEEDLDVAKKEPETSIEWQVKNEEAEELYEKKEPAASSPLMGATPEEFEGDSDDDDIDPNMICLRNSVHPSYPGPRGSSKRPRSPSPASTTRNLRPRTVRRDYTTMFEGSPEPQSFSRSPSQRRAISRVPSPLIESHSDSDSKSIRATPARRATSRRARSKSAKLPVPPPLQPGDETKLSRKEYCRRNDGAEGIKAEEASINLHGTVRETPPPLAIDFEALSMDVGQETFGISRARWTELFGGSRFGTETTAKKQLDPRYKNMLYLNREYNPDAPQMAGEGGLYMESENDPTKPNVPSHPKWEKNRYVLVTKVRNNEWRLIGLVKVTGLDSLTPQEFEDLNPVCKATWLNNISKKGWGRRIKARIRLRRQLGGEEPSADQVQEEIERETAPNKQAGVEFPDVSIDDIEETFLNGKSRLQVYQIKVVEYPHTIQRHILNNSPHA